MAGLVFILILLGIPVVWQIPRTFWRVHLNASGSAFTGLYRRYSVNTVTGCTSNISTWTGSQTFGSVTGSTSGTLSGGFFSGTTTVHDGRRTLSPLTQASFLPTLRGLPTRLTQRTWIRRLERATSYQLHGLFTMASSATPSSSTTTPQILSMSRTAGEAFATQSVALSRWFSSCPSHGRSSSFSGL